MDKLNKINLCCFKFQKAIDDSISIELTFQICRITRLYFNGIYCCFKKFTAIDDTDEEDFNNDLEKLRVIEKLSYYSFKNFHKRL